MQLRDYQIKAELEIYNAWNNGAKNVLVQLDTGSGKTVLFTKIIKDHIGCAIAIAHRVELVSQISLTLARWGVTHNIISSDSTIRSIVALHMEMFGRSYFNQNALVYVAGVDTLVRMNEPWFKKITLVVQDEGHHPLKNNKWGRAAELFPNARGLYPTATPIRADGHGLGRHADGIMDALVIGPPMRQLINQGHLSDYRIIAPPNNLDLSMIPITASGDFSPPKLRTAVHKSCITGNVVAHYLKFAKDKLGVTFAVDIETAGEIAREYKTAGVSCEIISSKTQDMLRYRIMERFRRREILQLVNVDLLGEGVDVPAIEVVCMARPTQSYALYSQQFGRALRPLPGKDRAIIIDHVGNVLRHGLPDRPRVWSLDRRDKKTKSKISVIPLRTCLNPACLYVYERIHRACPSCGFYTQPVNRAAVEFVEGDLLELDADMLAKLRGEIEAVNAVPNPPKYLDAIIQKSFINKHIAKQNEQKELRNEIALWAGYQKSMGFDDSTIYRLFYFNFGVDIATAQTLNATNAKNLKEKINAQLNNLGITCL